MIATTPQTIFAVEALLALPFLVMGLSHILHPRMWLNVFERLAAKGHGGVLERTFLFELWPGMLIIVFHQDWSTPGILLTTYGHALAAKITLSLLFPDLGLRSLQMAQVKGQNGFIPAGVVLIVLGLICCARVIGVWT